MAKKVHVDWKNGSTNDYRGVAKIEEDRQYEHVTGWRLYSEDGQLIAKIDNNIAPYIEVSEDKG